MKPFLLLIEGIYPCPQFIFIAGRRSIEIIENVRYENHYISNCYTADSIIGTAEGKPIYKGKYLVSSTSSLKDFPLEEGVTVSQPLEHFNNSGPLEYPHYLSTEVTCKFCKEAFDYTELETDYIESGEDESYIDNICPKCGKVDCCELKYETPSEFRERTKCP